MKDGKYKRIIKKEIKLSIFVLNLFVIVFFSSCKRGKIVQELSKDICSILEDKNGNFWFGSYSDGVYFFNGEDLLKYTTEDGLSNNQVRTIQEDELGKIWFVTGGGICYYDGKCFTQFEDTFERRKLIEMDGGLKINKEGVLLEAGGGVYFHNNRTTSYIALPKSDLDAPYFNDKSNPYTVYCSLKDQTGKFWFGTQYLGVCSYDGNTFNYFSGKNLNGPAVRAIFEDSKGNIWFGNNGGGLFKIDKDTLRNITNELSLGDTNVLKELKFTSNLKVVWAINEDNDGNIWIGTMDYSGIWKYDGKVMTNYTMKDGLTSNSINCIYKDRKGILWIGTAGGALCRFNGERFDKFVIQ